MFTIARVKPTVPQVHGVNINKNMTAALSIHAVNTGHIYTTT